MIEIGPLLAETLTTLGVLLVLGLLIWMVFRD